MRNITLLIAFTVPALILLSSCTNGNMAEILRTFDDPFDETPAVRCYEESFTVNVSWSNDNAADAFILMRAYDSASPVFTEVYRGTSLSFTDVFTGLEPTDRYLYRLDKIRGAKLFQGEEYAPAVASLMTHDRFEPNDNPKNAVSLDSQKICTMPCARFLYDGTALYDVDWYSVEVPAHKTAEVLLVQLDYGSEASQSLTTDEFCYMEENGLWQYIKSGTAFALKNRSNEARIIRFKIFPSLTAVFGGGASSRTLAYSIELQKIE